MICDLVWVNGRILEIEKAKLPLMTATLHYGLGVFEGITAYPKDENLYIFRLDEHLNRLLESAEIYGLKIPCTKKEIGNGIKDTIGANNFRGQRCYIRILVYSGKLDELGVKNSLKAPAEVAIITSSRESLLGTKDFEKGKSAIVSSWRRISPNAMPPTAKNVANYVNAVLGIREANRTGADYVIFLDNRGFVSEGSGQNIFIVKGEKILTPPEFASILIGITRDTIMQIATDLKYAVSQEDLTRGQLYSANEIFLCGTAAEITPVTTVDGLSISETAGLVTKEIALVYRELVTNNLPKYRKWLTPVY